MLVSKHQRTGVAFVMTTSVNLLSGNPGNWTSTIDDIPTKNFINRTFSIETRGQFAAFQFAAAMGAAFAVARLLCALGVVTAQRCPDCRRVADDSGRHPQMENNYFQVRES